MSGPFPTIHRGDIVYVDFIDGRPHNVITTEGGYDFEWCKRDGCMLYYGASGGCAIDGRHELTTWIDPKNTSFWAADTITLILKEDWDEEKREYRINRQATAEDIRRLGLTRLEELPGNPFEDAEEAYHGTEYCKVCKDHFDRDHTCRHLFDLDSGGTGGPGSSESDFEARLCKGSFQKFARATGFVRALRKGVVPFTWERRQLHATGGIGPSFVWVKSAGRDLGNIADKVESGPFDADELRDGINWFFSLDEETTEANARTAEWLDEVIAMQDSNRASVAREYVVKANGSYYSATGQWLRKQQRAVRMSWANAMAIKQTFVERSELAAGSIVIARLIPRGTA